MFIHFNPNPLTSRVGDCVVRAISKATNSDWERTYLQLCVYGLIHADLPSANAVWGAYLKSLGFKRKVIPNNCPTCYTVKDFCKEHPKGTFILAISGHVVAVVDGNYYDTWDSGNENPIYYWEEQK